MTFTPLQEFFGGKAPGNGARFPWLFGAQAQQIQKQYTELRYRLLPFRYSNALIAYQVKPVTYPVRWIGFAAASEGWYFDATARTVWVKFPLASVSSTTVSF